MVSMGYLCGHGYSDKKIKYAEVDDEIIVVGAESLFDSEGQQADDVGDDDQSGEDTAADKADETRRSPTSTPGDWCYVSHVAAIILTIGPKDCVRLCCIKNTCHGWILEYLIQVCKWTFC